MKKTPRLLSSLIIGSLAAASFADEDPAYKSDRYDAMRLEATSMLGEVMYHFNDLSDAKSKFRDSLGVATKLKNPGGAWVALDLYRSAELAYRDGDDNTARHHLEILVSRYPETVWAAKAEALLARLPDARRDDEEDEELTTVSGADQINPGVFVKRLQAAMRARQFDEVLRQSQAFRQRYPTHPATPEIRLLEGLSHLYLSDPARAAQVLEALLRDSHGTKLEGKTRYVLGASYLMLGDNDSVARIAAEQPANDSWGRLAHVWRALADLKEGRAEDAQPHLEAAVRSPQASPIKAYALAALAADWDRRGEPGRALKLMQQAEVLASKWRLANVGTYSRLALGHLLYRQREYVRAADAYRDFTASHPNHDDAPLALYQRAMSLKWAGNQPKAVAAFNELVKRYPDSKFASAGYLQLGQLHAKAGRSEDAIESYEKMGQASSDAGSDKEAVLLIAQVHYNKKEFAQAIPHYLRFLETAPDDRRASQVQALLLNSYWLGGKDGPELESLVDKFPNQPVIAQIRWDLGAKAYHAKKFTVAERHFSRLITDFPRNAKAPDALYYLAESQAEIGKHKEAAESFGELADRFPKSQFAGRAAFKRGLELFEAGEYQAAAEAYDRYRGGPKDPPAADAMFNRALALERAGMKEYAADAYEKLLAKSPKYGKAAWAWMRVAAIRDELGQPEKAAAAYLKVQGPDRAQALLAAGRAREKLKQRDAAKKIYEELRRIKPGSNPHRLQAMMRLGLFAEIQDPQKAWPIYQEIIKLSRDAQLTANAKKRLAAVQAAVQQQLTLQAAERSANAVIKRKIR